MYFPLHFSTRQVDPIVHQAHAGFVLPGNQTISTFPIDRAFVLDFHTIDFIKPDCHAPYAGNYSIPFQYAGFMELQISKQVNFPCCLNLFFGYAGHSTGAVFLSRLGEANQKHLQELMLMIRHSDKQESEVHIFIKEIRCYAAIEELEEAVLNRLISKILVGEVKKIDEQKVQEVRIVFNFVGEMAGSKRISMAIALLVLWRKAIVFDGINEK